MNTYLAMKERHEKDFSEFTCFFAFSTEQFNEGMKRLGLEITDTDKVYKGPAGMIYKRTDAKKLRDMLDSHTKEHEDAIKADTKGDGFLFEMFRYELNNHEYSYTLDPEDTLDACGISWKELQESEPMKKAFTDACSVCCSESY